MERTIFSRIAGMLGIAGALFWCVALSIEYQFNLFTPGGALSYFDQELFLIGQCCYLICVLGLLRSRLAGDGWGARAAVGAFLLGQGVLVLRAGRWRGWTRYAPLALGLYFLSLVLGATITGNEPTLALELLWQLPWLLIGLGLTQNAVPEQPRLAAV